MWHYFPNQYMPSYQVNRALTQAHYGGGEFAEILEVASEIDPAIEKVLIRLGLKWVIRFMKKPKPYANNRE
jgi:hypothetical protein